MTNHYQITKTSFGVSGTELKGSHVNGETKLAYQRRQAQLEHTITLEKILLSDQQAEARKEANGYVGKSAGLKSFLNVNTDLDMRVAMIDDDEYYPCDNCVQSLRLPP